MSHLPSTPRPTGFRDKAKRAWKVADSLRRLMKGKDRLPQREAVRHIDSTFGGEFLYTNRNANPAISPSVLAIFEMFTEKDVVWAKYGHYWRRRRSDEVGQGREVRY